MEHLQCKLVKVSIISDLFLANEVRIGAGSEQVRNQVRIDNAYGLWIMQLARNTVVYYCDALLYCGCFGCSSSSKSNEQGNIQFILLLNLAEI